MSNLVKHAKRELELIDMGEEASDEMNRLMGQHIIKIVEEFAGEGHSGFSASYAVNVLEKLLRFEPISDLTGADDEWVEVEKGKLWQNNRCSRVFKDAEGDAYDVDGLVFRDADGDTYTSKRSHMPVVFPYRPLTQYRNTNGKEAIQ